MNKLPKKPLGMNKSLKNYFIALNTLTKAVMTISGLLSPGT